MAAALGCSHPCARLPAPVAAVPGARGPRTVRPSTSGLTAAPMPTAAPPQTLRSVVARSSDAASPAAWWEQDLPANFVHVDGVQELVDELAAGAAADQLVVVDFFAPWCRACRALFPKFKRLCADNPDVRFVGVNFDENKGMARGLGVKVLPFFHFYRGAEGRVDEFTASVSKVARLRDAIADHKSERCFLTHGEGALEEGAEEVPLPEFPSVVPGGKLGAAKAGAAPAAGPATPVATA